MEGKPMKMNAIRLCSLGLVVLLCGFVACGSSGGGEATVKPHFVSAPNSRTLIARENLIDPFNRWITPTLAATPKRGVDRVAQTTAASLTSLQYYIQTIQLCNSIQTSGSSYSNPTDCIELYSNRDSLEVSLYNSYSITEATSDTDENHFIDFLSEAGRAKLEVAASVSAGTYNYALINFMRPIKMKAEFKDTTGTTIHRTKAGGTIVDLGSDDGGRQIEAIKPSGTTSGDAEVMTYMLNNGGVWFPMLKPFVVAAGDDIVVDFAFNPENFATTTENVSCSTPSVSGPYTWDEGNCVTFNLPYAKMSPVPRKSSEVTKKEVYSITDYDTTSGSEASARLEIYFNGGDADKAIRAVDTAVVMKNTATQASTNVLSSYKVSQTGEDVTLYGYNSSTGNMDAENVTGLTRRTNGTLTIHCIFTGGPCASAGTTVTKAYTYVGEVTVE